MWPALSTKSRVSNKKCYFGPCHDPSFSVFLVKNDKTICCTKITSTTVVHYKSHFQSLVTGCSFCVNANLVFSCRSNPWAVEQSCSGVGFPLDLRLRSFFQLPRTGWKAAENRPTDNCYILMLTVQSGDNFAIINKKWSYAAHSAEVRSAIVM